MDPRNPSPSVMRACISREGRHVLVLKENHVLSVFRFQPSAETELVKPIWEVENVRSSIWHHEESLVLLSKRNGDLEWRSFRRNTSPLSGRLAAEQLLKHLILKRLEFDSLKEILCLSFQRNFCILQTSSKQIAGLRWRSDLETEIVWALEVGEFAVWSFCDKLFVNFEPHTKSLHLYSLFEGRIKRNVQLEFSDSLAVSPVRKISSCPDGKNFAVLTDQLLIGQKALKLLLQDGRNICEISMGTSKIAVFIKQPEEYLLFNFTTMQKLYSCKIDSNETIIFAQRFDRVDRAIKHNLIRDLKDSDKIDLMVSIDVRTSLLNTALNSQHLESTANILKITERGNETEICEILRALNEFLTKNLTSHDKMTSSTSSILSKKEFSPSPFGLQVLGLSLGFVGRAYKKFPDCATVFNFMFAWQELLPIPPQEPLVYQGDPLVRELSTKWQYLDDFSVIKDGLLNNCLPIAQCVLSSRNDTKFQHLALVRKAVIDEIRQNVATYDSKSIDQAEALLKAMGCDAGECWERMCLETSDRRLRDKLVEIIQQRHLWTEELNGSLDFISLVERFVRDSFGHVPVLTMETVSGWNPEQRRLYLAEAFLQSKNEEILAQILPEDVWQVMLNKQILCSLRKWIENQTLANHLDSSIPYSWPISSVMIDMAARCTNNDTHESVLNLLANQGIFAECERQDLTAFINRLVSIGRFHQLDTIIQQPLSNVTAQSIAIATLDYCANHFEPDLFYDIISEQNVDLVHRPTWMKLIQRFQTWKLDCRDHEGFMELCRLNNTFLKEMDQSTDEEFWIQHPFVTLFFHLTNPSLLPNEIIFKALKSMPILAKACEPNCEDPSIRQLLVGEVPINVDQFFKNPQKDWERLEHPYSVREEVSNRSVSTCLDWTFYLRQSRPFRAYFHIQTNLKMTKKDLATYPFVIQAIGLEDPWNKSVLRSCVLLIEMLGYNSHPFRTTLNVLEHILPDAVIDRNQMISVSRSLLSDPQSVRQLSQQLEAHLLKNNSSDVVQLVQSWHLAVELNTAYGLDLPVQFLQHCAGRNQWLTFLLYIQLYKYPLEICLRILEEFTSPVKLHLKLALKLGHQESDTKANDESFSEICSSNKTAPPTEAFYRLLLQGSPSDGSTGSHLLKSSLRNGSVELAVLTAVLEPQQTFPCLCAYLALKLRNESSPKESVPSVFDAETISNLVLAAMSCCQFDIVLEAFHIFVPNHLLTRLLDWLQSFSHGETGEEQLELVRDAFSSYEEGCDLVLFRQAANLFQFALHLLSWALCHLIQDADRQQELLSLLAQVQPLAAVSMDIAVPDFGLLAEIVALCVDFGIEVNMANLMQGNGSCQFQTECQQAVEVLLEQRHFGVALKLANMANLPADSIFVTQLSTMLDNQIRQNEAQTSSIRFRTAFWNRCNQLLTAHRVRPDIASAFFRDALPRALSHWESHLMLDHAINWMRLVKPTAKSALAELEILWWQSRIEADLDGTCLLDVQSESAPFHPLLMAKISELAHELPYPAPRSDYSLSFMDKVTEWIGRCLDGEDLIGAIKLSSIFRRPSLDLDLILYIIDLVENPFDAAQSKKKLEEIVPIQDNDIEWKDRQSVIDHVDGELLQHGHRLCQRLSVFNQVAMTLDLKYDYVVEHSRPISILKMLLETPNQSGLSLAIGGHLNLARSWIAASRIAASQVVALVKDELIEAARSAHGQVSGTEINMVVSLLRGTFNRWVTLCADPIQLGRALLQAALHLEENNEWTIAVELLIFAHSSFTLACDVENIGQILNQARSFIDKLLLDQQWILITRLTTGIQRYTEMNYVFALLKENDQFEYLLRKGMDRLPLLRQALLDFLRPNCVENRELFRLVALHFHMHAEVATMWQEEANSLLRPVIDQAFRSIVKTTVKKSVASPLSKTLESSPAKRSNWPSDPPPPVSSLPMLKSGLDVKKVLTSAMHNLAHAAEYFLQAGKLDHANRCALQAELVALQIHLIARSNDGQQTYCILGLNAQQVDTLICETLTYPEAEIVSRAYGFPISWGKVLMRHYILNDSPEYLTRFARRHAMTPTLVEEVMAAFELESGFSRKPDTLDRFERLVVMLTDVEAKYRLASRLGLRHLVGELLSSSALPYLKDTAWGKKANQD